MHSLARLLHHDAYRLLRLLFASDLRRVILTLAVIAHSLLALALDAWGFNTFLHNMVFDLCQSSCTTHLEPIVDFRVP